MGLSKEREQDQNVLWIRQNTRIQFCCDIDSVQLNLYSG